MIKNNEELMEKVRTKYEFITFLFFNNDMMTCGVVQNEATKVIMVYDFLKIKDEKARVRFLALAERWWWQSSQMVPINMFIGREFDEFSYTLVGYTKKSFVKDPIGPIFSLNNLYLKRPKKKRIDLVNRAKPPTQTL